jgi:hypothetical protein
VLSSPTPLTGADIAIRKDGHPSKNRVEKYEIYVNLTSHVAVLRFSCRGDRHVIALSATIITINIKEYFGGIIFWSWAAQHAA